VRRAAGNRQLAGHIGGQWNVELSGAVYEGLQGFEVVLRNRMAIQISSWNSRQIDPDTGAARSSDWLMDPAPPLGRITRNDIPVAVDRARKALTGTGAQSADRWRVRRRPTTSASSPLGR